MIYGKLTDFEAMGLNSLGETVARSVEWIRNLPAEPKEGRHALWEDGIYALVLRYATGGAAEPRFETHRKYVDLQYTLAGSETIEWAPRDSLANDGDYDAARICCSITLALCLAGSSRRRVFSRSTHRSMRTGVGSGPRVLKACSNWSSRFRLAGSPRHEHQH